MYLIVGLGNPGKQYEHTRHNVGFMVLDEIAYKLCTKLDKIKFKGVLGEGRCNGKKVLLLKPHTYMNLSGQSVKDAVSFFKIDIDKIIVIYDDIDLNLGKIRIRKFGSSGGHKGMDSIIYNLETDRFCRIRIGIGTPDGNAEVIDYVLGKFHQKDALKKIQNAIKTAADAALTIVEDGIDTAMNRYNGL